MASYVEGVKQILAPEAFEDFLRKNEEILPFLEDMASKFKDLNPLGMEHLVPLWMYHPWMVNWIRERGGLDLKTWFRLEYEEFVEWGYRVLNAITTCKKASEEKLPPEELIKAKWLCHLSHPPAYMVRPDLGFPTTQLLYGKYATTIWAHIDYWRGEFDWLEGFHNEDGVPVQYWIIGTSEEIAQHFDQEDREKLLTPTEFTAAPKDITASLDRRHLRTGIKLRDMPKKCPFDLHEWLRPVRDIVKDLREEMFPKWVHATLYLSVSPGIFGVSTQQNFWANTQWWGDPWVAMNAPKYGIPLEVFGSEPLPPLLNTLITLPKAVWTRRLGELFLGGPKGLICDAINKKITPEEKTPLLHQIRRLMFDKGKMYKNFAEPYDDGIPPPLAFFTAAPVPIPKEANIRDMGVDPADVSKEYKELLESEAGIDAKTGRVPGYGEVPRLKWLFDPTIEWLKPEDFPPLDWSVGQVWPIDITREKMELMVEEGYDGSGEDILHYSVLADRKMGQEGKTIMLGGTPYKRPTE